VPNELRNASTIRPTMFNMYAVSCQSLSMYGVNDSIIAAFFVVTLIDVY